MIAFSQSLFGMNEYLEGDTRNIILLRIAVFIKQQKLEDKTAENISHITEFGFAVWKFLFTIYEAS